MRIVLLSLAITANALLSACGGPGAGGEPLMHAGGPHEPQARTPLPEEYVEGELLVKFAEPLEEQQVADLVATYGGELKRRIFDDIFLIGYPENEPIEQAIQRFQGMPQVLWAEPNAIRRPYGGESIESPAR